MLLSATVFVIIYVWPAFILPLILGSILLIRFRQDNMSRVLGWLTLKPIAATFLLAWYLAIFGSSEGDIPFFALIPGPLLTFIISFRFRNLFKTQKLLFGLFLGLDALRWINTFIMLSPWVQPSYHPDNLRGSSFYIIALILPNVYALIAMSTGLLRARNCKIPTPTPVV